MERLKFRWKRVPNQIRKPLVLMIGFAVVGCGIAGLILPVLPGWALIFVGFAILATEFAFAVRVRDQFVTTLKSWLARAKQVWKNITKR